ncbi:hypothetical protein NQ176_g1746 [Zarea fungicola]|uniref:Uncharacterized protein n=1 Tax=Zarea fungicola TaxID=93591 RepID=A0ACC1NSQ5_9HYPO|nr:hypothetical protein NQ176_g1746 [Lecanicillium fungicola]
MAHEPQYASEPSSPPNTDQINRVTNKGKGDTWQIMVSTAEDGILHGANDGDGVSRQLGGQYDKNTVLQLSKDMLNFGVPTTDSNGQPSRNYSPVVHGDAQENEDARKFAKRHGSGRMQQLPIPNTNPPSALSKTGT